MANQPSSTQNEAKQIEGVSRINRILSAYGVIVLIVIVLLLAAGVVIFTLIV